MFGFLKEGQEKGGGDPPAGPAAITIVGSGGKPSAAAVAAATSLGNSLGVGVSLDPRLRPRDKPAPSPFTVRQETGPKVSPFFIQREPAQQAPNIAIPGPSKPKPSLNFPGGLVGTGLTTMGLETHGPTPTPFLEKLKQMTQPELANVSTLGLSDLVSQFGIMNATSAFSGMSLSGIERDLIGMPGMAPSGFGKWRSGSGLSSNVLQSSPMMNANYFADKVLKKTRRLLAASNARVGFQSQENSSILDALSIENLEAMLSPILKKLLKSERMTQLNNERNAVREVVDYSDLYEDDDIDDIDDDEGEEQDMVSHASTRSLTERVGFGGLSEQRKKPYSRPRPISYDNVECSTRHGYGQRHDANHWDRDKEVPSKEELDEELDGYMAQARIAKAKRLNAAKARIRKNITGEVQMEQDAAETPRARTPMPTSDDETLPFTADELA